MAGHPTTPGAESRVTCYTVVTREGRHPIQRFHTVEGAADYIVRERAFGRWKVLAQEANKADATTPYRELRPTEKQALERKLFPTLFDD